MRRAIITLLVLLSFGLKAQVYQAMPQAGYGPVKRMLFDSVLTIPLNINQLRNITGGRDAGQIRYNVSDSGLYVFTAYTWIKANLDSVNLSNRINGKLNITDTAYMLSWYMRKTDTLSLSNRINLRVKYTDTAAMLDPYLRKLDTASLSRRIDLKQNALTLTTNFKSGASTLVGATLNIPKYSDTLQDNYVPYVGAIKDVDLGAYQLNANSIKSDYLLQVKNTPFSITPTSDYTSITPDKTGFVFYTSWLQGQSTYTQSNRFNYANQAQQNNTREYNLPVRNGTLALVEDTVNLSNRINLKADKATTLTINGVGYDLSANRTWTIPTFDSTSISNRINLKLNISDTASMLSPYLRKADTSSLSNRIDLRVKYSDTAAMLSPYLKSAVTSVGLSMPSAFTVSNSPVTTSGTIAVAGAGTSAQYIRGDGVLATYNPGSGGGGSSQVYYFNGGVASGVGGYQEMSKVANTGASANFSINANGYIASFLTGAGVPNQVSIPAGNWNFEIYMSASSGGGSPSFYVELYKYDGTTFTLISSSSANPEYITNGTSVDLYVTALSVPATTLLSTDRLAVRVYVTHESKTITMHTQNGNLSEVITTFTTGLGSLNGLIANTQYLSTGTSGSDFNISSVTDTHTFNLPTASSTKRGALSSADWGTFNGKMNYSDTASLSNRINLKLNYSDTVSLSNRINTKLNSTDTASLSNRINAKADALSGTTNTVPKFTSSTTIGNSNIKDNGNAVTINATAGSFGALQVGSYNGNILMNTTNSSAGLTFQNTSSSNKLWDFSSDNNDLVFNESNVAPVMKLKAGGNVVISNLSGTGTRMVVADANGVLSSQAISNDTTSLSNRINTKLNISDTASMLSPYLRKVDTASLSNRINTKQGTITLTTTGTSGAATFTSNTLNIPQYQAAGTYVTSVTGTSPIVSSGGTTPAISIPAASSSVNGYLSSTDWTTFNNKSNTSGTVTSVAALTLGTSGTDLSSTVANSTTTPVITLNIPTASASNRGALSSADWTTFNGKQNALTNPVTGTGTANYISKFTGSTTLGNSLVYDDGTNVGIGLISMVAKLHVQNTSSADPTSLSSVPTTNIFGMSTSPGGMLAAGIGTSNGTHIWLQGRNVGGAGVSYPIVLQPLGGPILINTTTDAGYKLDVNGTGRFSGNVTFNGTGFFGSDVFTYNNGGIFFSGGGSYTSGIFQNAGGLQLQSGGSPRLTLASTGAATFSSSVGTTALNMNNMSALGSISGGYIFMPSTAGIAFRSADGSVGYGTIKANTSGAILLNSGGEGNVGIGTTSPTGLLDVRAPSSGNAIARIAGGSGVTLATLYLGNTTGNYGVFEFNNANDNVYVKNLTNDGNLIFQTTTSGSVLTTALTISTSQTATFSSLGTGSVTASSGTLSTVSDSSYKIADGFIEDALPSVMNLKPRYFYWKDKSGLDTTIRQLGFYAQEVNSAIGEEAANTPKENSPWGINDRSVIAMLTKAIQEQQAQIKDLQTKIQTLENK